MNQEQIEAQAMTWQQLKDFANSLNETQLSEKVRLFREDELINSISADVFTEAQYIDLEEAQDGCFGESHMRSQIEEHPEEYTQESFKKVYDKGVPYLSENF